MISRLTSRWMNLPLRGKGLVVVAIPFIALVISAISFTVVEREQRSANDWVARSLLVRNTTGRVIRYQTDAAASVRGYLLTGNVDYLTPAQQALQDLPETLAALESLVHDNPQQFARAQQIRDLSQENMSFLAQLQKIAAGVSSDPPASVIQQLDKEQATLNDLRDTVSAMQATEDHLLAERTARVDHVRTLGTGLIVLNLAIGLAGGFFAMMLFTTGIVRRVQWLDGQTVRLAAGVAVGAVDLRFAGLFFLIAYGLGLILDVMTLLLEELSFHRYEGLDDRALLILWAALEQFGYRQLTVYWRMRGLIRFLCGRRDWGTMQRKGFGSPSVG